MIVNRLPYLMEQKMVSIRQLLGKSGITYTTVRAVYHGERRSVQLEVLDVICEVLDVQPGDIYVRVAEKQAVTDELMAERSTEPVATQPDGGEPQALDEMALEMGEEERATIGKAGSQRDFRAFIRPFYLTRVLQKPFRMYRQGVLSLCYVDKRCSVSHPRGNLCPNIILNLVWYLFVLFGIMEIVDSLRAVLNGPIELPHILLAILVLVALVIAERFYGRDD